MGQPNGIQAVTAFVIGIILLKGYHWFLFSTLCGSWYSHKHSIIATTDAVQSSSQRNISAVILHLKRNIFPNALLTFASNQLDFKRNKISPVRIVPNALKLEHNQDNLRILHRRVAPYLGFLSGFNDRKTFLHGDILPHCASADCYIFSTKPWSICKNPMLKTCFYLKKFRSKTASSSSQSASQLSPFKTVPHKSDKNFGNILRKRTNDEIKSPYIRLIDQDGIMRGIVAVPNALEIARMVDLDLVEVSPLANPPVCKIVDAAKLRYQQEKSVKARLRQQRNQGMKEIHLTARIADRDLNVKCKSAIRFLNAGHQVKFVLYLRGRERLNDDAAEMILDKVLCLVAEAGSMLQRQRVGSLVMQIYNPRLHKKQPKLTV